MSECCTTTCGDHSIECKASSGLTSKASNTSCTSKKCSVSECCEAADGKCSKLMGSETCSSTKYFDTAKAGVAATATNFDEKCCTAKPKCDGYTCSAGYELKSATTTCSSMTCSANSRASASCELAHRDALLPARMRRADGTVVMIRG